GLQVVVVAVHAHLDQLVDLALWQVPALRSALDRLAATRGGSLDGAPVRGLLADVAVREVSWSGSGPPPWFDCDTDEDVRRAEEWTR
ncbi:hypothetical protein ACISRB_03825, partial [Micromonospora aurantiaca]